jgi:lipoprotein-releasing system ATP-binding protein
VTTLLRAEKVAKVFRSGTTDLIVLDRLDFEIEAGEMVAIVGESGSGKSTLLQILGALDKPTSGELYFDWRPYSRLSEAERSQLRNSKFGFVWQMHYLLPEFTARENVMMPLLIRRTSPQEAGRRADELLERVGLSARVCHRAGELSGGEQQRVALARALVAGPSVLLADEPTGSLDAQTGENTFQLMEQLHRENRMATVLVTHNAAFAQRCDRVLRLANGRLEDVPVSNLN